MMNGIFLLLGGNIGDTAAIFMQVTDELRNNNVEVVKSSSLYRTAAWGKTDQPDFLNQVLQVTTSLSPGELLDLILKTEEKLGRVRKEKWGSRIIDIDLLYYDQKIVLQEQLMVPHPQIENRMFTLLPLNEIASDFIHPVYKKSQQWLLAKCKDKLPVVKL